MVGTFKLKISVSYSPSATRSEVSGFKQGEDGNPITNTNASATSSVASGFKPDATELVAEGGTNSVHYYNPA